VIVLDRPFVSMISSLHSKIILRSTILAATRSRFGHCFVGSVPDDDTIHRFSGSNEPEQVFYYMGGIIMS
jgi:hypothetical protein